tara:strand:- start:32 stop:178 length:147 start_codon:yes stop_codon:yes gene_type:complete
MKKLIGDQAVNPIRYGSHYLGQTSGLANGLQESLAAKGLVALKLAALS